MSKRKSTSGFYVEQDPDTSASLYLTRDNAYDSTLVAVQSKIALPCSPQKKRPNKGKVGLGNMNKDGLFEEPEPPELEPVFLEEEQKEEESEKKKRERVSRALRTAVPDD